MCAQMFMQDFFVCTFSKRAKMCEIEMENPFLLTQVEDMKSQPENRTSKTMVAAKVLSKKLL